jgi:hypothetical protein
MLSSSSSDDSLGEEFELSGNINPHNSGLGLLPPSNGAQVLVSNK